MASVAMANGVNPELLRNWVMRQEKAPEDPPASPVARQEEIIVLPLVSTSTLSGDIQVEVRREDATVTGVWPTTSASECAAWLRALPR